MNFDAIRNLVNRPIQELGYEIADITLEKEQAYNGQKSIVISITKPGGVVTITDCVKVSKRINPILFEDSSIPDSYIISVSSTATDTEEM